MSLAAGTRLGPYHIVSALGAGGMGEVYRARDTRLERTVAIKVLPEPLASNPGRKHRLEREAKAISSLNHPNICQLYDLGSQDGTDYLVMELLEGESLADRLRKGPLPLPQALKIGGEIADALDRAHCQGIIHRDLKPGNIMLTKAGAKLLDFGLAKPVALGAAVPEPAAAAPSTPTLSVAALKAPPEPLTQDGTIVGTFQYMAPEVLQGGKADARSDIFSLGCVLYEMITGQRAFPGKSQISVLAAILEKEPEPITSHQPLTPPALDHVVRRCLAKDPEERWQSARDLQRELKWISEELRSTSAMATQAAWRERLLWPLLGLCIAILVALLAITGIHLLKTKGAPPETVRLQLELPSGMVPAGAGAVGASGLALSPDGSKIAIVVSVHGGPPVLWLRPLNRLTSQVLPGTEGAAFPFWAPDNHSLGFFSQGKLKRIDVNGGPVQIICDAPGARGATWNRDGVIVFAPAQNGGLFTVSASGGEAKPLTIVDTARQQASHRFPQFLPDGKHFLFLIQGAPTEAGVAIGSLDSARFTRLEGASSMALYSQPGYLLNVREGVLVAQRFDVEALKLQGDPIPVADSVAADNVIATASFSVSENDVLSYGNSSNNQVRLTFVSRNGQKLSTVGDPADYLSAKLSPDGLRVAMDPVDAKGYGGVWMIDLKRGTSSRFTFTQSASARPIWSPDGRQVAFYSHPVGTNDLYLKSSDGGGEERLVYRDGVNKYPSEWSRDGRYLVYQSSGEQTGFDIWVLPMTGDRKPVRYLQTPFNEMQGQLSPDNRWMAYTSDESGRLEVYVQSFPLGAGKWQISTNGGSDPLWRRDGRELFYLSSDGHMMAVPISTSTRLQPGTPQPLFALTASVNNASYASQYDVTADGQKFLIKVPMEASTAAPITVVLNWVAGLKE